MSLPYADITTPQQLQAFCRRLDGACQIAFDTEFVAERTYRPVLCLVQVAVDGQLALIDAIAVKNLDPFWEKLVQGGHETVAHAGRGELEFCYRAVGRLPPRWFDVQVAAGLVGIEYPASYGNLLVKLLGEKPNKQETRTDWRRRPLSPRQIEYALDDIRHLPPIRDVLHARLVELGRLEWMEEETAARHEELLESLTQERWRRVSGHAGLGARSLAIVRELWRWREAEAERRNCPVRYVLRDDLLVELAKRQTADLKRIRAVRGLDRTDLQRQLPKIAEAIARGLALSDEELPPAARNDATPQLSVLGQFLFAALGTICRQAQLSPGLVGTPNDVRDLVAHRTGQVKGPRLPALAQGWRAQVVGRVFDDLLSGKLAVRIGDPESDAPLVFEP